MMNMTIAMIVMVKVHGDCDDYEESDVEETRGCKGKCYNDDAVMRQL